MQQMNPYHTITGGIRQTLDPNVTGLVKRLKNDRLYHPVRITIHENLMQVSVPRGEKRPSARGDRQRIEGFTTSSRNNMLRTINKIRNVTTGYFAHLTYPSEYTANPQTTKTHIAILRKRLVRLFPNVGGIWRMELKRRKTGLSEGQLVPHFHILLWGISDEEIAKLSTDLGLVNKSRITVLRIWLSYAWNSIAGDGDLKHLSAGTRIDRMNSIRHATSYASKYAAKIGDDTPNEDDYPFWGRRWGRFGNLDLREYLTIHAQYEDTAHLKRFFRSMLIGRSKQRERDARATGKKYRHRRNKGYWNSYALKSDRIGCCLLGFGVADKFTLTRLILSLRN